MIKRTFGCVVVCGCLMAGGALEAHHSLSAVYDIRQTAELTGEITKVEFMNPHGAMTVEVENEDGSKTEWIMTTGSANVLSSLGFGRGGANVVYAGDVVTITYFPSRSGSPLGFMRSITLPNETEIEFEPDE